MENLLHFPPSSSMYTQLPHLRYLLEHHPLPLFERSLIDLFTGVLDFMR